MQTYRQSPAGRRTTLVLLVGALIIWAFALWTLRSTLNLSYNPLRFLGSLQATIGQGLSVAQVVPAVLMMVLIVATPLVMWNLLEEWSASLTPTETGLQFSAMGFSVLYPWSGIRAIRRVDDDEDEPMHELVLDADYTRQIKNPLVRFLHGQSYGRAKLPIYAGLERRDELLEQIARHVRSEDASPDSAGAAPEQAPQA
jgi:hypothetical protein